MPALADLLGVRSSKGRYYQEYRHSTHDLERTLMAVNALSWVLAEAPADARYLVDQTLPVIAGLLGSPVVLLVSDHPALGGRRVCLSSQPATGPQDPELAEHLVQAAEQLVATSPSAGLRRLLPERGCQLLLVPLPRSGRGQGYVVAALPMDHGADTTDLAILGTLANQLAGAVESCQRLTESEASRQAADDALRAADVHASVLARRNELLRQARYDLAAARAAQALADERQRIARDLHDSVAQQVLSIGMQVEWCRTSSNEPELVTRLGEVKELARTTVDRIRQAIFELSGTDELHQGGLVPALRRLSEQHRGRGLDVDVEVTGDGPRLPGPVERALFMTAKEALFNIAVHAEASHASVHLSRSATVVQLSISDDGLGRAEVLRSSLRTAQHDCAGGHHRGLVNVEERLLQVAGRLSISDVARRGVRLEAVVPVQDA